jgi:hypothetical protein
VPLYPGEVIEVFHVDEGTWFTGTFEWSGALDEPPLIWADDRLNGIDFQIVLTPTTPCRWPR